MENGMKTPEAGGQKVVAPNYEKMYFDLWKETDKLRAENKAQREIIKRNDRELELLRGQLAVVHMIFGNR